MMSKIVKRLKERKNHKYFFLDLLKKIIDNNNITCVLCLDLPIKVK